VPRVVLTPRAVRGLECCRAFLEGKDPLAARRAADAIATCLTALEQHPLIGRPVVDQDPATSGLRELTIPFGDAGFVALYALSENNVVVLAIRHQREAGW
jgi:plasmid stabilization system protein ParE